MLVVTFLLTLLLAAVNGGNDTAKGVATLAGAGLTRYRTAILWAALTTGIGSLLSLAFASRLTKLFSAGIVSAPPTLAFALAVLTGAITWVGLATIFRLPVSTTHAIVGGLIGAGIQLAPGAVHWQVVIGSVAVPLLASVLVSYALSAGLNIMRQRAPQCTCIDLKDTAPAVVPNGPSPAMRLSSLSWPVINVVTGTEAACRVHRQEAPRIALTITGAHWLTSGATSFARGLNDTPKIVAIGAFGLSAIGADTRLFVLAVAISMAAGGLIAGARVGRILGEGVVHMSHAEGFRANLVTAVLIGAGANLGLPMSTTHVVTGAIAGVAGSTFQRLNRNLLRDFVLAWTITPAVSAAVSGLAFGLLRQFST